MSGADTSANLPANFGPGREEGRPPLRPRRRNRGSERAATDRRGLTAGRSFDPIRVWGVDVMVSMWHTQCMDITYEIKISTPRRKDFDFIVRQLKFIGGTFDPSAKTWTVTVEADASGWSLDYYAPEIAHLMNADFHDAHFYASDMTITEVES